MRVTLYTRANCPLCDDAKEDLRRLGVSWDEVDIDADPELRRAYGERIPVIAADGRVLAEGNLRDQSLARLLDAVR